MRGCTAEAARIEYTHLAPGVGQGQRGSQAGGAGTDDQDIVFGEIHPPILFLNQSTDGAMVAVASK